VTAHPLAEALEAVIRADGLLLIGPGAPDPLPPGVPRRHVPPDTLCSLAEGARLATGPGRPVVALGGESDLCGASLGALMHAARRNTGITCIALAEGPGKNPPPGVRCGPPHTALLDLVRAAGGTHLAECALDERLTGLVTGAMAHAGFSLLHVAGAPAGVRYQSQEQAAFADLLRNQAPLVTAVWSAEPDVWDWLLWVEAEDDEEESEWAGT
jgi:hypothetical protein